MTEALDGVRGGAARATGAEGAAESTCSRGRIHEAEASLGSSFLSSRGEGEGGGESPSPGQLWPQGGCPRASLSLKSAKSGQGGE